MAKVTVSAGSCNGDDMYNVGQGVRLNAGFTVTGSYADPDIVTCSVKTPSGDVSVFNFTSGTVSQEDTGKFFKDIFVNEPGQWWYEWFGTGTALGADEGYFIVERSVIP